MTLSPSDLTPGSVFMDDFYAECDEHLVEIRQSLLQLEQQGGAAPEAQTLDKIFRSLHSVKGLCGMAGLQAAEKLAHVAEDYLRAVTRRETALTGEGLDVLTRIAGQLEALAAGHRTGQPEPDLQPMIDRTNSLLPRPAVQQAAASSSSATSEPASKPASLPGDPEKGTANKQLKLIFRPSADLDRRGINIGSVRAQLQRLGDIVRAVPKVEPGGELLFEFILDPAVPALPVAELAANGVQISPIEPQSTPSSSPPPQRTSVPGPGPATAFVAPSHFVRIEMTRLDDLMRMMGDIVVQQARLEESLNRVAKRLPSSDEAQLQEVRHGLSRDLRHLRDGLMRLRLVPVSEVFERLPFIVRDLCREYAKRARLVIKGQNTELDKYLVERMKDPLLHLVRNAISHGIEDPPERLSHNKPEEGTITLSASTVGEIVVIEVSDDGRGIDPRKVAASAQSAGLQASNDPNFAEVLDLICTPGFSTRPTADLGAGRGMGMAAVKSTIDELGGELELESESGCGSTFRLRLPLTLAVADALIISAGGQRFAMPQSVVQEITTTDQTGIHHLERNEIIRHRNAVLPLLRLTTLFGLPPENLKTYPVLVIGTGLSSIGIVADHVLGHREVVVRTIKDPLLKVPGVSGATELGDGRVVLILDSVSLAQRARVGQSAMRKRSVSPAHQL